MKLTKPHKLFSAFITCLVLTLAIVAIVNLIGPKKVALGLTSTSNQVVDKRVYTNYDKLFDKDSNQKFYYKWVTVTAYCPCKKCCGRHAKGYTASGKKAKRGMVAASRGLPFGTRMRINGKEYKVEDRLSPIYDHRVDVFFPTHAEALKFGIKIIKIKIFK